MREQKMTGKEALEFMHKLRMDNFDKVGDCLQQLHRELECKQELEEENAKLKKAIEIIKQCSPNLVEEKSQLEDDLFTRYLFENGENPMSSNYVLAFMRDSFIPKEAYELLKEVLGDAK